MLNMQINKKCIGESYPVFIVAEIGCNHQGDINIAKQLIDAVHDAGVDAVKFQKRDINALLTKNLFNMPYTGKNSFGETYGQHRLALEFSLDEYINLKKYTEEKGLVFFASPWDCESVDFLEKINLDLYKISSSDLTNMRLINYVVSKKKPIIISTGMSSLEEIDLMVSCLRKNKCEFALLQCTSAYPVEYKDINLKVIDFYKKRYNCIVGYSGHELNILISCAAVAAGAQIIERHITLDLNMKGNDHQASLTPPQLKELVNNIRAIESALGNEEKVLLNSELPNRIKLAKSVTSKQFIMKGTVITSDMLTIKSPGSGIAPYKLDDVIGKVAARDIKTDTTILEEDIIFNTMENIVLKTRENNHYETTDAVIIGSGIMGLATAYNLAKKGLNDIIILEKSSFIGGESTSRCAGGIRHQFSTSININLSKKSIELIKKIQEEFDKEININLCGYLFVLTDKDDLNVYRGLVDLQREHGVNTQWLSAEEVKKRLPMMNLEDVVAGTFCADDGLVEPNSVTNAYLKGLNKYKVKIYSETPVTGIGIKKNKVQFIDTPNKRIYTNIVINAAGPWAKDIGKMAGLDLPIKPVSQQLFNTSLIPEITNKFPVVIFPGEGLGFHKEDEGILSGLTKPNIEAIEYSFEVDCEWEYKHCEAVLKRFPSLEKASILSSWAGLYDITPDDHPIIGDFLKIKGFYCIAGFSGHGFMHAPVCGLLLSEIILDGKASTLDISELSYLRFAQNIRKKELLKI